MSGQLLSLLKKFKRRFISDSPKQPLSTKHIIRFLVLVIVILAILAGVLQELYVAEKKRYARLEDRYVRVRNQLGRDVVQKIIDQSREEE